MFIPCKSTLYGPYLRRTVLGFLTFNGSNDTQVIPVFSFSLNYFKHKISATLKRQNVKISNSLDVVLHSQMRFVFQQVIIVQKYRSKSQIFHFSKIGTHCEWLRTNLASQALYFRFPTEVESLACEVDCVHVVRL